MFLRAPIFPDTNILRITSEVPAIAPVTVPGAWFTLSSMRKDLDLFNIHPKAINFNRYL